MNLKKEEKFEVKNSDITFDEIVNAAPREIANDIKNATVIILPSHGTNDAFYSGTLDILDFLKENGIDADVLSTDDEYKEINLHGDAIWLGTFIITSVAIPIFCNVISSYIYDKIKAKSDDDISLKFIAEKKNKRTLSITFEGKVDNLEKALKSIKELTDGD